MEPWLRHPATAAAPRRLAVLCAGACMRRLCRPGIRAARCLSRRHRWAAVAQSGRQGQGRVPTFKMAARSTACLRRQRSAPRAAPTPSAACSPASAPRAPRAARLKPPPRRLRLHLRRACRSGGVCLCCQAAVSATRRLRRRVRERRCCRAHELRRQPPRQRPYRCQPAGRRHRVGAVRRTFVALQWTARQTCNRQQPNCSSLAA